ncbi:lipocalin-like domain-containing protein [Methylobacterium sp. 174MFSha1.1]|uniref:lipocalin-like domain-containing protein n=1 Tax=Methylobacterium sp. 174MFSha1.1 TaxID=1502749 RepID=UPI0015A5D9ED|nr:lipocalin-like domain-containing protein [Methylobacterium sp. 174MFSha1.1]
MAALLCVVAAVDAQAAEPADFYGTWKLRSVSAWIDGREVNPAAYGPHPTGFIHYLPGGRMAAVISYDGRKPMKGDRLKAAESEKAEAYASFLAYAGTFRVEGDKVIHHVEASAYQNDVGSEQVRFFRRDGDTLHLESVPLMRDGKPQVYKLVWDRLPDR